MASALALSRFPVGSSARISAGIVGQRQADADALLFAAAQFLGTLVRLVIEADEREDARGRVRGWQLRSGRP